MLHAILVYLVTAQVKCTFHFILARKHPYFCPSCLHLTRTINPLIELVRSYIYCPKTFQAHTECNKAYGKMKSRTISDVCVCIRCMKREVNEEKFSSSWETMIWFSSRLPRRSICYRHSFVCSFGNKEVADWLAFRGAVRLFTFFLCSARKILETNNWFPVDCGSLEFFVRWI